jgi:hypothetical protein
MIRALKQTGGEFFEIGLALGDDDPALQQYRPELVDERRAFADLPIARYGRSWACAFNSTKRLVGRVAASAIPSASRSSFFRALT